jgi:hypothetical protein
LSSLNINIIVIFGDFQMIDNIIDDTLFVIKNLDEKLQKVVEQQKKLDAKMDQLEHTKTKIKKKLFPLPNINIK